MNNSESIKQLTKLVLSLSNGKVEEVEPMCGRLAVVQENAEELEELRQAVFTLIEKHLQAKEFISDLSEGNLEVEAPQGNLLVDPFKGLQANLRYMVWQTQQIAHGDYSQRIDFLGDFSDSFNSLVNALAEKKKVEEALRVNEERFRSFVENANDVIYSIATDGTFIYVSPKWTDVIGHDVQDVIGQPFMRFVHPDDVQRCAELIAQIYKTGEKLSGVEYRVKHKDGTWRWHVSNASAIFDAQGRVTSFLGIGRDITARKQIEDALKKSEQQYRNIFDNSIEGIFQSTLAGRLQIINPAFAHMFGYDSPEEMISQVTNVAEQLYVRSKDRIRFVELLRAKKMLRDFEVQFKRKDGSPFWVSINSRIVLNSDGLPPYLEGTFVDITKRKLAEDQIKLDEARLESLLRINQHPADTIQELLDFALDEVISLTESKIGYIYFYDELKQEFKLNTWSKQVMQQCSVAEPQTVYSLDKTGIWGETVRQGKPVLVNDFEAVNTLKKGIPEGHAPLYKFLTIPVFSLGHIVAVVGVANKQDDYNDLDIRQLNLMMDSVWKIVQRKKNEEAIAMSEASLKRAELASRSGNWEFHLDSQTVYASEGAMIIYGIDKNRIDYSLIKAIPLPEYRTLLNEAMDRLLNENIPYDIEFKIRVFGTAEIKDVHSMAFYDKEKNVIFGIIQDITQRKQSEEALKESEAKFRTLFTHMSEGFAFHEIIFDETNKAIDYRIIDINPSFEKQVGIKAENAIGKLASELYGVHSAPYLDIYSQVAQTGNHHFFQAYFSPLDKYFEISVFSPNPGSFATVFSNITERKKAELALQKSQSLLSNALKMAHLGPWEYDVESDLFTFNDSFYAIFRTTADEVGGYTMSSAEYARRFVYPDDMILVSSDAMEIADAIGPSSQFNHRILYADGEVGYITVRSFTLKDERGKIVKTYGINQDITERIKIEENLKKSEAELREINAAKDKFFSIIAHDLKNPLNSIVGFSDLLAEQVLEKNYEGIEEFASIIQNSSKGVMDLLMNLLEWSRSQTGRLQYNPEFIDLNVLINQIIELSADAALQKSITLNRKLPRNAPVIADKAMISTVLRNLISNAIKFTNPGGQIIVSVEQNQTESFVSVADNGVGIKKSMIGNLFKIEESYSTAGTQNEKGSGLGLILCKEFIEKHNGKIEVESEPGKGSKFTFSIPKV